MVEWTLFQLGDAKNVGGAVYDTRTCWVVGPAGEAMTGLYNEDVLWEKQYFNLVSTNTLFCKTLKCQPDAKR